MSVGVGDRAPEFTAPITGGGDFELSSHRGEWVVLYFYPKDNTPGCTLEAKRFRDHQDDFADAGATVVGVSADSISSHETFAQSCELPFGLVTDSDGKIRARYGVRRFAGLFPGRVTYVIDPDGIVRHVFRSNLQPVRHVDEALAAVRSATET